MKKILLAAVSAVMALVPVTAAATTYGGANMEYSGVLGSYYEEENPAQTAKTDGRIEVSPDISYDPATKLYYIYADGIAYPFISNVTDGMITAGQVSVTVPDGVSCELYRNGELYGGSLAAISERGSYILRVQSNSSVSLPVLTFTVTGASSGSISSYTMPDGFSIENVTFNGNDLTGVTPGRADFGEDGVYTVEYRCRNTNVHYSLTLTVDTVAPELKLSELKDGKCWGPVDISDVEQGGSVAVYRNGNAEAYTPQLTKSGQYTLVVSDAAGNETDYSFTIMIYFNSGSLVFMLAVLAIFAGVGVYILIARKKLRVR